jgi:hypothetical protein
MAGVSNPRGTILRLLNALADAFKPLETLLADANSARSLLTDLGVRAPVVPSSLLQLRALVQQLGDALTAVEDLLAGAAEDSPEALEKIGDLGRSAASVFQTLQALPAQLQADLATYPDFLAEIDVTELVKRLAARLLIEQIRGVSAVLYNALLTAGLIEVEDIAAGLRYESAHTHYALRGDRLSLWLPDASAALADVYGWGTPEFDHRTLLLRLHYLLLSLGYPGLLARLGGDPDPASEDPPPRDVELHLPIYSEIEVDGAVGLDAVVRPTIPPDAPDTGLLLTTNATGNVTTTIELRPGLDIVLGGDFKATGGIGVELHPPLDVQPVSGAAAGTGAAAHVEADISVRPEDGSRTSFIEQPGLLKLDFGGLATKLRVNLQLSTKPVLMVDARVLEGLIAIGASDADGFLAKILPTDGITAPFELGIGWRSDSGAYFLGSAGFEVQLPVSIDLLGAVHVNAVVVSLQFSTSGIAGTLTCSAQAALGPLNASVDRVGVALLLHPAPAGGTLGPLDAAVRFQPPKGIGLSLDAGVIKGGGYLYIDIDRGQYAGSMDLVAADWLALHAIGLITTKMPDGSKGFSLLVIITADFGAGIQLSFGFTLLAVGGLLGLNRAMLFQPLIDDVRTGAINSILFPEDAVANAQRIISDLQAIFPPKDGTFLIGPMAKLGWGTPTLVSLSLGVIIEIPPGDIAILGALQLALPTEDDAILVLRVVFAGALEFDKKRLYFFASLYDSHILFVTIDGEMGVLFAFGDNSNLVLSVGGFHPQFNPPPLPFPTPTRIQLNIINESYARIRADGYFAVTTNTVQFGAHAEYFFGFSAVSVTGHSSFDALFQISPFHFSVSVRTAFSANVFGVGVYGVDITLILEGTEPWHARGHASLSFLFFSIGIPIDATWGDNRDTSLPPIPVMPILAGELGKQANWRAFLPAGSNILVSLRKLDPAEVDFVLHPLGTLQISQRAVPLDLTLDKVGNQKPSDANRFTLDVSSSGLIKTRTLTEPFAPGQFKDFDDATKLSEPAYAPQDSGVELSVTGTGYALGTAITRNVRYDLTVIDTQFRRYLRRFFVFTGSLFDHFLGGASVSRSTLSAAQMDQMQPSADKVVVSPETYTVARRADNTPFNTDSVAFASKTSAQDYLQRAVSRDPALAGKLHVLPQFEVAA